MPDFSEADLAELHRIWRALPAGHCWSGWAMTSVQPGEIWLFRERVNWRRFSLVSTSAGFDLMDEERRVVAQLTRLAETPEALRRAPALDAGEPPRRTG